MIRTRTFAYQGLRNSSFSENFANVLNGWSLGYIWAEDKEHCEEYGRMLQADPSKVSVKAKKRGLPQVIFYRILLVWY